MHRKDFVGGGGHIDLGFMQLLDRLFPAALQAGLLSSGFVDEDAPHGLLRRAEEVTIVEGENSGGIADVPPLPSPPMDTNHPAIDERAMLNRATGEICFAVHEHGVGDGHLTTVAVVEIAHHVRTPVAGENAVPDRLNR